MLRLMVLLVVGLIFLGCDKKNTYEGHRPDGIKFTEMDMRTYQEEFILPKGLWNEFESVYRPLALNQQEAHSAESSSSMPTLDADADEEDDLLKRRPPMEPFPFTVYLIEQTPGVLNDTHYELKYHNGGGVLDLRKFVNEKKKGTFRLIVQVEEELDRDNFKIFFLSQAQARTVGGKAIGNGCKKFYEITTFWKKAMADEGIVLNTRDEKYVSFSGGVYSIVSSVKGKLRLAHLLVRDSRHNNLMCPSDI